MPQSMASFSDLNAVLKAAGETTRLRVLALLAEAGLVERFREGSWAFFRMADRAVAADVARSVLARLDPADPVIVRDRERLTAVRATRAAAAQAYFRAHAAEWDRIRALHVADAAVESAIVEALGEKPFRSLLDLGTGTGRMLELFGPHIERGLGIDLSLEMLAIARSRLERAGLRH